MTEIEKLYLTLQWERVDDSLPDIGVVVHTKIHDERGERNEQPLKRGGSNGRLWFFPDGSMYVYYVPTHWRPISIGDAPDRLHAEQPNT